MNKPALTLDIKARGPNLVIYLNFNLYLSDVGV